MVHRISVIIEKEDIEKLNKIAKKMDRNLSDTVRHLIRMETAK